MKLLGLDIGDKRVGVAFGDMEMRLATPVGVFARGTFESDVQQIANYAREYAAEKIIAGLPRNTDGTIGPQAKATEAFVGRVADTIHLPIVLWDEHLTTVEAARRTGGEERAEHKRASTRRSKKSHARRSLDAAAAAIILQDYIDYHSNKSRRDAP